MIIAAVVFTVTRMQASSHRASPAMARTLKKALAWLTIVAIGVPAILGTALHCVPGCQHELFLCECSRECADEADHSTAEHHHQPGMSSASGHLSDHGHSCPICSFLSSGKLIHAVAVVFFMAMAIAMVAVGDRIFVSRWKLRPFGPRGPPSF